MDIVLDRFAGVGAFGADEGTGEDDRRAVGFSHHIVTVATQRLNARLPQV